MYVAWIREDFQKELAPILNPRLEKNKERKGFSERQKSMGKDGAGLSPDGRRDVSSHVGRFRGRVAICVSAACVWGCSSQGHDRAMSARLTASMFLHCAALERSAHCRESLPRGGPSA